ncbi:MAG: rare lipoprotein [Actinomycetota bacterium]|jgi:hypothetical protein|nr:rare lipoprotein [Actinomycetota bacterium]
MPRARASVALACLVALATVAAATGFGAPAAGAAGASEARVARQALLLRIGTLTDRLDTAQAEVLAAELRQDGAEHGVRLARAQMRERAVAAYVYGKVGATPQAGTSAVYLNVAVRKDRAVLASAQKAMGEADRLRASSEQARDHLRNDQVELSQARRQLDALVAADDARRAADQEAADAARARAMAARSADLAAQRGRSLVSIPSGPGYAPSPLDPNLITPRHRAATQAQLELMARYPFGPLAGTGVPSGLRATGQVLSGKASWYGPGFNGRATASGAIYDQEAWTAASRDLPLGTLLIVSKGDRRVLLLVNDRGPYVYDRILDLSHGVATYLGVGVNQVTAEVVTPR